MCVAAINNTCSAVWNSPPCFPLRALADKVRQLAETVFGYILRIVTFQMGEMRVPGAYYVMRLYQKLFSYDPREEKPLDSGRLQQSKDLLVQFGGVEDHVPSAAGGSNVHLMTFTPAAFFNKFHELGADPINVTYEGRARRVLLNAPEDIAAKFYFPVLNVNMPDGTVQRGALLPDQCPADDRHILYFHSPGRSMIMDRKIIGACLGSGISITISDQRGTGESAGTPSEGGYYADAQAVMQALLQRGIRADTIYTMGFCEGAALATHIKKEYHHLGVHLIATNPYTSMREVVEGYGLIGRLGIRYGEQALKDPAIPIAQDCFDNEAKLRGLRSSNGKAIFIHTDTDKMMPHGTVSRLIEAFNHAGPVHEILRIHPNPNENGHLQPPTEDPLVWRRLVQLIT